MPVHAASFLKSDNDFVHYPKILKLETSSCILCGSLQTSLALKNELYTYLKCAKCGLYFVHPAERLPPETEKERYELHENSPTDQHYRNFLRQIFEPLNNRLAPNQTGLDYGSGPGPTLSIMLEEAGHSMETYDPFFHDDKSVLKKKYDFITCTETAEHFYNPAQEFDKLWAMLKPGGLLGIMTLLLSDPGVFEDWYYRREDTHVAFYQKRTFGWLAKQLEAEVTFIGDRTILFKKNTKP